ncbi:hypothetical protein V5O48_015991 [Marasmius crinis-equi]|uniref:Integrase core domain-containing protein n=1 Tax=Marasmius crinis-equi TaxID=585013 RepID=A0ABR3ET03_9AGAR
MYFYRGNDSYLWGKSVYNTRAERPWLEVNVNVLNPWKEFFEELESLYGLDRDSDELLGLLHLIFLPEINRDLKSWQNDWNHHQITFKKEKKSSRATPIEMWNKSQLTRGIRGLEPLEDTPLLTSPEAVIPNFGFSDLLLNQMRPRVSGGRWIVNVERVPESMAYVEVDPPRSFLMTTEIEELEARLRAIHNTTRKSWAVRRQMWIDGCRIASELVDMRQVGH